MTTPAIRALKESVDERKITLLSSPSGCAIARYIPEIDHIIEFTVPWEKSSEIKPPQPLTDMIQQLKEKHFDAAVLFTVYSQNPLPAAMLCYLAGIPRVAGYCRENPYRLITDWLPDTEPLFGIKHEVTRQLDLVKMLGALVSNELFSLRTPKNVLEEVYVKLDRIGVQTEASWIVMHPGVSEAKRQCPLEIMAEAAQMIIKKLGYQVILSGIFAEKDRTDHIATLAGEKVFSTAGIFNLEELIALIKHSPLLISNNTGPVHIASAVGTPVLVLYALTNPQHTPWKVKHRVLPFDVPPEMRSKNTIIRYAYEKSFSNPPEMIKPEQILQAVKELLYQPEETEKTELVKV